MAYHFISTDMYIEDNQFIYNEFINYQLQLFSLFI